MLVKETAPMTMFCSPSNQEQSPEGVLIRLVDFRRSVSGQTLTLSADDPGFYFWWGNFM